MKKITLVVLSFLLSVQAVAAPAVQRTLDSSYEDYQKYLNRSGHVSFVDAYVQLSSVIEMETPLLEKCLEEVYLRAPADANCLAAVKSLSSKPLNPTRREVLLSFLIKLEKVKTPQKSFYKDLKIGLLRMDPKLAQNFHLSTPEYDSNVGMINELEMKAWKKAVLRKFPITEVALLINGKKVSKLEKWSAPLGVYQWSLVTNTHEPLVRLGTFSQFAAESLRDLKPLASESCSELENLDVRKFGLLQVEVFSNTNCVAEFGFDPVPVKAEEHLGGSSSMVKMEKSSPRHWIWPFVAIAAVGIASSLKDKQVSLQMPGVH